MRRVPPGFGPSSGTSEITSLLGAWSAGDDKALEALIPRVYGELRRLAARRLRQERASHTLQTTGLLHETYLRLTAQRRTVWKNRAHFFAVSARLMRRVLVDYARARAARKRDGGAVLGLLIDEAVDGGAPEVLGLDEALRDLEELDVQQCRVVELRFFGGLTQEEIADVLAVSVPTVARRWRLARAWLYRHLHGQE